MGLSLLLGKTNRVQPTKNMLNRRGEPVLRLVLHLSLSFCLDQEIAHLIDSLSHSSKGIADY